MRPNRRTRLSSITSIIALTAMIFSLVSPLALTSPQLVLAEEEVTEEAPVDPVGPETTPEIVEETPAEPPTETVIPPEETEEPTTPPTEVPPTLPDPTIEVQPDQTLFQDDFQTGSAAWRLSSEWSLEADGDNVYLTTASPAQTATVNGLLWDHLTLSARIGLMPGGVALFAARVGAENYAASIDETGSVRLYRGQQVVAEGVYVPPVEEATAEDDDIEEPAEPELAWYQVGMLVYGDAVTVAVNDQQLIHYVDPAPLPGGMVVFASGSSSVGQIALDDIVIQRLDAPTPTPEDDAIVIPEMPTDEPAPEITDEVTEEPTVEEPTAEPELTEEPTAEPEVTDEPELTPEVTPEVTEGPEATEEPALDPEATEEPEPDPEATPEVTDEPDVDEPAPLLYADFEGELTGWALDEGATIVVDEDGNSAALLAPGTGLRPSPRLHLSDQRLEARVTLLAGDRVDEEITAEPSAAQSAEESAEVTEEPTSEETSAGGISLFFRADDGQTYRLSFEQSQTALYRMNAEGSTLLTSVPAERDLNTWYALSLEAIGDEIAFSVDGVLELSYTDETPLLAGTLAFIANDASVLLDDVVVYDLGTTAEAEPTPAPYSLDDEVAAKFGGAFLRVLKAHLEGDDAIAAAIADDYFMERDDEGRFYLIVWGADDVTGATLAAEIEAVGGVVDRVESDHAAAYIPLDGVLPLAALDAVSVFALPDRAVPTGANSSEIASELGAPLATGSVKPHSLDILGVNDWHLAGARGAGVQIAVIDGGINGGFNTTGSNPADRACLASGGTSTGGSHGINVVEVICDIAPQSQVHAYTANSTSDLVNRINTAVGHGRHLIVITIDTSITGDGSGIQTAIQNAHNAGVPVIAAAGNAQQGAGTFVFDGTQTTVTITTSAGSTISYGWEDESGDGNYPSTLYSGDDELDSRSTRTGDPAYQYTVPASCGDLCELTLVIEGEDPTEIQIRAAGDSGSALRFDDDVDTIMSGTLTTAASVPQAIAVGAVCASQMDRYPIRPFSSQGAGNANTPQVKPEVVAPAGVYTSLMNQPGDCDATVSTEFFDGTSAAAAHVAGMSALLLSNPNADMNIYFSQQRPQRLRNYLMTRVIDLGTPGFDNTYGAGLVQLGDPLFNMTQQINYSGFAVGDGITYNESNSVYVGTATLGTGEPAGTPSNPFVHPRQAIQFAVANNRDFVIFQAGEFVTPFQVAGINGLTLISYSAADLGARFPSRIRVNDIAGTTGAASSSGLLVYNANNVTIEGLRFTGSQPEHLYASPPSFAVDNINPLAVENSTNVTVRGNLFRTSNRPVEVSGSNTVTVANNTFDGFTIPFDALPSPPFAISYYPAAALHIQNSGSDDATAVNVTGNRFTNNFVARNSDIARHEAVVLTEVSRVNLFRNYYRDNQASSVITINQWIDEPIGFEDGVRVDYPVIIYSSTFENNTVVGPIVHLYQGQNFRFVNNTVAQHELNNHVILLGHGASSNVHIGNHRFDIHNNLFYHVRFMAQGDGLIQHNSSQTINLFCESVDGGGASTGATHNWLIPQFDGGVCQNSVYSSGLPTNGNMVTNEWNGVTLLPLVEPFPPDPGDPNFEQLWQEYQDALAAYQAALVAQPLAFADFEATTFFGDFDPAHPFRLLPFDVRAGEEVPAAVPPQGVDDGNNARVIAFKGVYDFDTNLYFDLIGAPRIIDRTAPFVEDPGDCEMDPGHANACVIDIGAYELGDPAPVTAGDLLVSGPEDTTISFAIDQNVTGGYRPYSFTFSNLPAFYDPNPNNICAGQPISYDPEELRVTYCPPPNLHTSALVGPITFDYTVTGSLDTDDNEDTGTVTINVTPVDDGSLGSDPADEPQVVFTDSRTPISYRLRPYVDVAPPVLSFSDADSVDYPFSFSGLSIVDDPGSGLFVEDLMPALNNALSTGTLNLTPVRGEMGRLEFTYTVTDGFSRTAQRRVRVVVADRLAGPGIHDDVSLNMIYNGSWTPYYHAPAFNTTTHFTSSSGASLDFFFTGDGFVLHWVGYSSGGNYQIQINPEVDLNNPFAGGVSYHTLGLTCSTTSQPNNLSTQRSSTQIFTFGCQGLDDVARNEIRRMRITRQSGGLWLDAIEVRGQGLPPGLYQDKDFALDYDGNWISWSVSQLIGGTSEYTSTPGSNVEFTIDGDRVDTLVIYRTMANNYGTFGVYINDNLQRVVQNHTSPIRYSQPVVITGIGGGLQEVEIRHLSGSYIIIEAIELLGRQTPLSPGLHSPVGAADVAYLGSWTDYNYSQSVFGPVRSSSALMAASVFRIDGYGVSVHRVMSSGWRGKFELCVGTTCRTFGSNGSGGTRFGEPATVYVNTPGPHLVQVRSLDALWIGIEAIEVHDTPQPALGAGYYEHNDARLAYNGDWITWVTSAVKDGSSYYSSDSTASMTFRVDDTVEEIIVYYTQAGWAGTALQACRIVGGVAANCQDVNQVGSTAYGQAWPINTGPSGLNLDAINNTVILRRAQGSSGMVNIEAIELRGQRLPPGLYQDKDPALAYEGSWTSWSVSQLIGGTSEYTSTPGSNVKFTIDGDRVDTLVIYRTMAGNYGIFEVYINGDLRRTVQNHTSPIRYGQPVVITEIGSGAQEVEIRHLSGSYIIIEAIELLGPQTPLSPGLYSAVDTADVAYLGSWTDYNYSQAAFATVRASSALTGSVLFEIDGYGVSVQRVMGSSWRGEFELCVDATCRTFGSNGSGGASFGEPATVYVDTPGPHIVQVNSLDALWMGIEAIEVHGIPQPALGVGYYEHNDFRLSYDGNWLSWVTSAVKGGSSYYSSTPNASVTFKVDADEVERIFVYYTQASWAGNQFQACRLVNDIPDSCQPLLNQTGPTLYGRIWELDTGPGGLDLDTTNNTVILRRVGGSGSVNIEAIELLKGGELLAPGYYDQMSPAGGFNFDNYGLEYTGTWQHANTAAARGGTVSWTNDPVAEATFDVIPDEIDGIVVYYSGNYGPMDVCHEATCVSNITGSLTYGNRRYIAKSELDIIPGTDPVTITIRRGGANWIGLEGIQIVAADPADAQFATLGAGITPVTSSTPLTFIGGWQTSNSAGAANGVLHWNTHPSGAVMFKIDGYGVAIRRFMGWGGSFEVCLGAEQCQIFSSSGSNLHNQPAAIYTDTPGPHVVEVRGLSGYIGLDTIEVLDAPQPALGVGYYEQDDVRLSYDGNWLSWVTSAVKGGSSYYSSTPNASVTFKVDADEVERIFVYYTQASWSNAQLEACRLENGQAEDCQPVLSQGGSTLYGRIWELDTGPSGLDLDTTNNTVILRRAGGSGSVNIEAIEMVGAELILMPGYYEESDLHINLIGTWTLQTGTAFSGGTSRYATLPSGSQTSSARAEFTISGGTTGIVVFSERYSTGGIMRVCFERESTSEDICENRPTRFSSTQRIYGHGFYGLPSQISGGGSDETYNVTITLVRDPAGASGAQYLTIDAVAVLGEVPEILQAGDGDAQGRFDDRHPGIVYSPGSLWQQGTGSSYYNGTWSWATNAGAVAQFTIEGSSLTLYQFAASSASRDNRFCVVVKDSVDDDRLHCANYSMNRSGSVVQAPITLYGFGSGIHELYLENRDHGRGVLLDAIEVR